MEHEYKTLAHRWFNEVWNQGRGEAIDEMFDCDAVAHGLADETGQEIRGPEMFKPFYANFRNAFPDIHITIEDALVDGDKVAVRCLVQATHQGEGIGLAPTNLPVAFTGICIMRTRDGKIIEAWNNFDFMTMYQQLGVVKSAATPGV